MTDVIKAIEALPDGPMMHYRWSAQTTAGTSIISMPEADFTTDDLKQLVSDLTRERDVLRAKKNDSWKDVLELDDFMCCCKPEGQARCDALMERISKVFNDPSRLLSSVVYHLDNLDGANYCGSIDSIAADMWAMISVSVVRLNRETHRYEPFALISVECDVLEHGLARVWELAEEVVEKDKADIAEAALREADKEK